MLSSDMTVNTRGWGTVSPERVVDWRAATVADAATHQFLTDPVFVISVTVATGSVLSELLSALPSFSEVAIIIVPRCNTLEWLELRADIRFPIQTLAAGVYVPPTPGIWTSQEDPERGGACSTSRVLGYLAETKGVSAIALILQPETFCGHDDFQLFKERGGACFWYEKHLKAPFSELDRLGSDFHGSIRDIAAEMTRLARAYKQPSLLPLFGNQATGKKELATATIISTGITTIYGVLSRAGAPNFQNFLQSDLRPRLARAMVEAGVADLAEYAQVLENHPASVDRLVTALTFGGGGWFRDSLVFEKICSVVAPLLKAKSDKKKIHVWVPGCSTGEEVFQIAISLLEGLNWEPGQGEPGIRIFGTDISAKALEIARQGLFSARALQSLSAACVDKYFVRNGDGFELIPEVLKRCLFQQHDLISHAPLASVDLIGCRNVLKCFGPGILRKVVPMLHYALKPGGFLLIGSGEKLNVSSNLFLPFERGINIYRKPWMTLDVSPPSLQPALSTPGKADLQSAAERMLVTRYAPPTLIFDTALKICGSIGDLTGIVNAVGSVEGSELYDVLKDDLISPVRALAEQVGRGEASQSIRTAVVEDSVALARMLIEMAPLGSEVSRNARYFSVSFVSRLLSPGRQSLTERIEELKASLDELESVNEELSSSNQALLEQIAVQRIAAADFASMMASNPVPTVLIDQSQCLKRISPACSSVLGLDQQDVGKPIGALALGKVPFQPIVANVLRDGAPYEESVKGDDGRCWLLRVSPACNRQGRNEAVVTLIDIDRATRAEAEMMEARAISQSILEGSPVPMMVLDEELRVRMANRAFLEAHQMVWREVQSRYFPEFAASKWRFPDVCEALETLLQSSPGATWSCDVTDERSFVLRAHSLYSHANRRLLVVLEDVSERLEIQREHGQLLRNIREKELSLRRTADAFRALSERQIHTQEDERRTVARELHDDLGQKVALLHFDVSGLVSELGVRSPAKREILQRLEQSVSGLTHDLRNIAHQIHPSILDDLGLSAAIKLLAEEFRQRNGLPVRIRTESLPRFLPPPVASSLYRITQEGLRNVLKHAGPTQVDILLSASNSRVRLEIRDYGNGFDPRAGKHWRSLGMLAMKERARLLKGTFSVRARPMKGVVIQVGIPLDAPESENTPGNQVRDE